MGNLPESENIILLNKIIFSLSNSRFVFILSISLFSHSKYEFYINIYDLYLNHKEFKINILTLNLTIAIFKLINIYMYQKTKT